MEEYKNLLTRIENSKNAYRKSVCERLARRDKSKIPFLNAIINEALKEFSKGHQFFFIESDELLRMAKDFGFDAIACVAIRFELQDFLPIDSGIKIAPYKKGGLRFFHTWPFGEN